MTRRVESARAAGKVSLAVALSRVLGVVRDQIFANYFGAGYFNDAWLVAFRVPNLFRDLFAEGALSAAVVPTFTEFLRKKGRAEAWVLANLILSGLLLVLGAFALILLIFSEGFVYLLAAGFADVPGKLEVTASLIRLLSPFLMLVAVASVGMAVLNTFNHFFVPALAPALFNVAVIGCGVLLVPLFEEWKLVPIYAMAVGALLGGLLQILVQLPLLRKEGFRFRFSVDRKHEGVRRIVSLMAPAIVGVSTVQFNVLVNTQIASFLQENGPVSWLSYAFRIIYLPIGLFGVAVGVVHLREVSILAAQEQWEELKETVANSIKLILVMALPSTVGLMVLAAPIVRVLFERGDFTSSDTAFTAYAVVCYSLGLSAYSCMKVYVPTFYALQDTRTPVRISILGVVTNLAINLVLVFLILPAEFRYAGLALGTALSVICSNFLLARSLIGRLGSLSRYRVLPLFLKALAASAVMGVAVYLISGTLSGLWTEPTLGEKILQLVVSIGAGMGVYLAGCRILKVEEAEYLFRRMRRQAP